MKFSKRRKKRAGYVRGTEHLEPRFVLDGIGLFAVPQQIEIASSNAHQVLLGDMDNDGDLDAVVL